MADVADNATEPGPVTRDGSPVEFYTLLGPEGEPEIIHGALGPGGTVLELGSGAGRVTHALVDLGHPVVAVDDSPEMLARINGAETVCSRIEDLDLGRRFDGVVLASHLINLPDAGTRRALLDTCRRHLAPDGRVLVERVPDPVFRDGLAPDGRVVAGVRIVARDVTRPDPDTISATMHYISEDRHWTQPFTSVRFDTAELAAAGLRFDRELDETGHWFSAAHAATG